MLHSLQKKNICWNFVEIIQRFLFIVNKKIMAETFVQNSFVPTAYEAMDNLKHILAIGEQVIIQAALAKVSNPSDEATEKDYV